jgi:hypothetical protein
MMPEGEALSCCRPQLLVRRRGLSLTEYGAVDARAAKRLRVGGGAGGAEDAAAPLPLGLAELEEYEAFEEE